jgi:ketosteroid isomerase-like protein
MERSNKYLTIYRRQPDGSWKIYRDISNSNEPPPSAAAKKK